MDKLIECIDLTKNYGKNKALNNVNINISDGNIYGLVGPNGAGKSTFLKLLAGYALPTSGIINLFNEEGKNLNMIRNEMGFLIEKPIFYSYLTGEQNLKYLCKLRGIEYDNEIKSLVKEFKIENGLKKKVKNYSTGMRQRLGLVAAVMNRPKILILDEPINGLDPNGIIELRNFILKINKEWNTTVIISSHILNELSLIATNIGFIKNGELIEEITSKELQNKNRKCIEILFDNDKLAEAVAILESNLNLKDIKILSNGKVNIYDEVNIIDIQRNLAEKDIYTKSILYKNASLEEYYVEIMGDEIND